MNCKKELLIIIPTYNEKKNIPIIIKNVFFMSKILYYYLLTTILLMALSWLSKITLKIIII